MKLTVEWVVRLFMQLCRLLLDYWPIVLLFTAFKSKSMWRWIRPIQFQTSCYWSLFFTRLATLVSWGTFPTIYPPHHEKVCKSRGGQPMVSTKICAQSKPPNPPMSWTQLDETNCRVSGSFVHATMPIAVRLLAHCAVISFMSLQHPLEQHMFQI